MFLLCFTVLLICFAMFCPLHPPPPNCPDLPRRSASHGRPQGIAQLCPLLAEVEAAIASREMQFFAGWCNPLAAPAPPGREEMSYCKAKAPSATTMKITAPGLSPPSPHERCSSLVAGSTLWPPPPLNWPDPAMAAGAGRASRLACRVSVLFGVFVPTEFRVFFISRHKPAASTPPIPPKRW